MSLMMPDGKSWTTNLNLTNQNPYANQPQQQPFGRVNSTAQPGQPRPGQGGIPQDAIFRSPTPSTGGTKAPDMSAYAPGKAQPVQQQSTGTPYGTQQRFDSVLAADAPWWAGELGSLPHNPADNRPAYGPAGTATGANAGNFQPSAPANPYANMAPGTYYGGQQIPGNQQQALDTAMRMRDAMAVQVNNNNLKYEMANAFGQDLGRPQFDYGSAMQQAQNMVQNGFYNPFTQYYNQTTDPLSQLGQNAPPSMYSPQQPFPPIGGFGVQQPVNPIQDLFAKNNIQTPPGFMDQLISLLGGSAPRSPIPQPPPMSGLPTQPSGGLLPETKGGMSGPRGYQPVLMAPQPPQRDGLRYVPAEYRDGKLWSDAHYVNDNPPIPEYAPPGMYGGRDPVLKAPESYRPGTAQPIQPPSQGTPYGQDSRQSDAQRASLAQAQRSADNFFGNGNFDHATVEDLTRLGYSGPQAQLILKENEVRRKAAREQAKAMYGEGWDDSMMPASDREAGRNKLKEATERYLDERLKQTDWEAWRRKQQQREAAAAPATPRPAPRAATPEDIAAIEKGRQYKQSQLNAFKSQFGANVRAGKYTLAGMSPELLQTARSGVESGDRDWGAWAEVLYGPGAVSRMQAAGHYR